MSSAVLKPDVITLSSCISAAEKSSFWQLALYLLEVMRDKHIRANEVTYNAAISACEKGGRQWQKALALLAEMPSAEALPNEISYNAAISASEKSGEWQWALTLLNSMRASRLRPNTTTFSAAISACDKARVPWEEMNPNIGVIYLDYYTTY